MWGLTILEVSKTLLHEFHFDCMKLLFRDTDSLTYVIKTEDIYDDMFSNKEFFDFSGYDKDSKYYNKESMKKKRSENEGRNGGDSNSGICRFKSENIFNINKKGKGN